MKRGMDVVEIAGIKIPDTRMALNAKEILLENGSDLLFNHSNRVYLFGALKAQKEQVKYDQELLYVSALFHDLGLTKLYSSDDLRFEVDGANAARQAVLDVFPRVNFKQNIIQAFYDGIKHKPQTTFGNMKQDVCAHFNPQFKNKNFCDCILHSPWKE